ncbi:MAG: YebC/PmpR family DNA-binding transcriptional regulator [Acidobacteriota bacterium]|nr:YebC/PmpR family DNA-binding transcriptional regulator [Acidobacteriota bacterium]
MTARANVRENRPSNSIDAIEDHDDARNVYANFDIDESEME